MLRNCIFVALLFSALTAVFCLRPAVAAPPSDGDPTTVELLPAGPSNSIDQPAINQPDAPLELFPVDAPPESGGPSHVQPFPETLEDYAAEADVEDPPPGVADSHFSKLKWLGLRHSSKDGRNAGIGVALVGTSWLNRPYYIGADLGTVWITDRVNKDITRDIDMFGGIYGGCDWDYYWGTELAVQRATPELINEQARDADRGDRMMLWSASLMYYPWGDSMFRPYWRCGLGGTEIDYPTDHGARRDEALWTFPIGVGIKYPVRRWLAARAEVADQIGIGNQGVATQHDLTLTLGLEWRFGAHPRSYWPWNPSRHIW